MLLVTIQAFAQTDKQVLNEKIRKADEASANTISFIENKGQWPGHVLYRADIPGGQMLATPQGMLIGKYDRQSMADISKYDALAEEIGKGLKPDMIAAKLGPAPKLKGHGWRFNFVGGSLADSRSMTKSGESQEYFNYLIGDASTYATNVHGYNELIYKNVYQNIDVRYYTASNGDLENDIVVYPGGNSNQLKLQIDGIENLHMNKDGELVLPTTVGDILVPSPVSYLKDEQGRMTKINIQYKLIGGNTLSFSIPDYDRSKTLVIDPIVMRWASWISGNTGGVDAHNHGIDVDAAGNIYATGRYGNNMITVGAFQTSNAGSNDVFISKYIEPLVPGGTGQRVWQTYMGTSSSDNPYAMNIGLDGNLYIVGVTSGNFNRTYGTGYPTSTWTTQRTCGGSIGQQCWVARVSPSGTWAQVREIGSASADFSPTLWDLRVISTGASTYDLAVVGSVTQSSNATDGDIPAAILPAGTAKTGTGDLNGYAFRISSDLSSLLWSRQFTSSGNNNDQYNIASVDAAGDIYMGGFTAGTAGISYNNPSGQTTRVGSEDGWLMKVNGSTGNALWSRYFNASAGNTMSILCMEFNRAKTNLVLGGLTSGAATYNITTAGAYAGGSTDFIIASVPATGAATNWGTYYGGNQQEYNMMGLNVDQNDDIYVLGYTYSKNITTVDYPLQNSTFNSNTGERQAVFFKLSGTNGASVLYNTFLGGSSDDYDPLGERGIKFSNCRIYLCMTAASNDFPLTAGTLTSTKTSSTSTLDPLLVSMSNPPDLQGNSITGGGAQTITCGQTPAQITAGVPSYIIPTIIRNNTNQTNGTTGAFPNGLPPINNYQWQMSVDTGYTWTNISGATGQNYIPGNLNTTGLIKFRRIINGDACNRSGDTLAVVNITVNPTSPPPTISNNGPLCTGQTLQLTAATVAGATYQWTGPNGFSSTLQNPTISNVTIAAAGAYKCILITSANTCPSYPSTTNVVITNRPLAPVPTSNSPVCAGQTLNLGVSGAAGASFAWTGPNSFTSSSASPSIASVTSVNAGTYFVTQTVSGCASPAASVAVVINTIPAPTGITANPNPICSGQTLTLTATASSGATLSWTFPDGGSSTGSPVVRSSVTTAMSGSYTVTQTASGCISNPASILVTVYQTPAAPVATASPLSVCAGSDLILSATGVTGAAFTWTYPDGGGSAGSPVTRTGVTSAMAGTYSVIQTVNGCASTTPGTVVVTVNPLPIVTAGSITPKYCSSGTISLTSSVTAGTVPYTYSWAGPSAFSSTLPNPTRTGISPAMSGIYNLIVTDNKGCTGSASTPFITVNQSPSVSATSNSASYCTGGTINLFSTPSVGPAPYTYSWSGPNGFNSTLHNPSITNITSGAAGIYSVLLTDSNGCTASASTPSLVVFASPSISVASQTPSYCSGTTISLSSVVTGGTPSYGYSWSGPNSFLSSQPNPSITNSTTAMAGVYTLTVTDNHSCTASASTPSLVVYLSPSVTASSTSTAYCESKTIVLNSSASGGLAPYTYSWSGPLAFSSNQQNTTRPGATTDMSGVYTVVATDAHLCVATASTNTITINPGFAVTASSNSPVCAGGTLNLFSSSTAGATPFTYSWSATSYTSTLPNPSRSGANSSMAGLYSLTVTDNNGCSGIGTTNVVVNPSTSISVSSNSEVCVGNTLTLQASPTSGTSPFTYSWTGPAAFTSTSGNPSRNNATLSFGGTYFVTVTDANGCFGTGSTSVVVNPLPAVVAGSTSVGYCVNSTIQLNATPSLGTAPYTIYNWSGPSGYSSNQQNPSILNATTAMAGNYSVTLTDSKGCNAQNSVSVAVYTNPVVSAGANQISCSGTSVTLGGNPTASGGNPPYNYTWNNGAANTPNPAVSPVTSTTYTVIVTDNKLCSTSANATVTVNQKPVANAGSDQTIPSCSLVGTTIGGSPTATGGTAPYTYSWAPAAGLSSSASSNPNVTGIGTTTSYTVIVTDSNGCTGSDFVVVNVTGSSLGLNITANNPTAWCASGSSDVTLTANATGGSAPYTYSWIGSNLSANNTASTTANPNIAGTYVYSVIVTDATGCQAGDTASVVVYPKPSANAGAANYNICNGDSVTLGGNPTASGGTSPFTYAWNNGASPIANPKVNPINTTSYTVTVSDAHQCTASASSTVTVRSNPIADAGPDVNLPGCSPTGLQIGGSPTGSGGSGSYTYSWGPAEGLFSATMANPIVKLITSDKTYTVLVTDANGCSATDQVIVHVISNTPSANISAGGTTSWCAGSGSSVNLTANLTGGTTPFSYAWSGTSLTPLNAPTAAASPSTANTYTYLVTVTDAFNCTATANKVVTVNANPSANAGSPNYTICSGQSVTIGGNPTAAGGNGPYTYTWSGGAASIANPSVNPLSTTTYVVSVHDLNNCSAIASSTVTVRTNPIADAGADLTMPGCTPTGLQIGGSPTAAGGGGGPYTYVWSPTVGLSSASAANPTVRGIPIDTTYRVTITDVNGCTAIDQMRMHIISNSPSINITSSGSTSWCAGGNNSVNLTANVTGGTIPLAYNWSGTNINPVNSQVATVYPNTAALYSYIVTVTDGYNCTATASKSINVHSNPIVSAGASIHKICSGTALSIGGSPTATGGIAPYTYAWNSGANAVANPSVNPLTSTTYIVTVTDSAGCSASASTTVLVRNAVIANAGPDKAIFSCRNACTILGGSPTGLSETGALTYAWSPSTGLSSTTASNPTACNLSANTMYTVTVTDTSGCIATDQVLVTVTPGSLTAEAGTGGAFCSGSGDSVMLGGYPTAVGGTPPYTYTWNPTTGLNLVNPANPVAYPGSTINYHLTITDAQGCLSIDSSRVRVFPAMQVDAGNDTAVCEGSSIILGGNPTATGGNGVYTYAWSPATDISNVTLANPIATPFTSTDYSVTATDGNGCSAKNHIIITLRPRPIAQTGSDKSITNCPLDSVVIGGSPSASGGTSPYTYAWSPSVGLSSTTAPTPIVSGISTSQTYQLTVTDHYGCKGMDNVAVELVPSSLQAYQSNIQTVCGGPNACIQLGGLPTAIGGTSPYTYTWANTATLSNPTSSNPIACPLSNTTYGLTVTDSKGCSVTANESIVVNPTPVVNAGNDTAICQGQSVIIGGSPTASGGSGSGYTYFWTPTVGINNSLLANPTANPMATTTYTIVVSDPNGCSSSDNLVIVVRPVPVADAGADKNISMCSNDSIFIGNIPVATGGTAPYTYQWSPSAGMSDSTAMNPVISGITQTTSYQVIVTDTFGCKSSDNVIVNVSQQTLQAEAGNSDVICASSGTPVTIGGSPSAAGGTSPYVYAWSPAAGLSSASTPNPIATVTATTTYYLTVTDAKGCISVDSVKITQNPAPAAHAGSDTALCSGLGKILGGNPSATGGTGTYQYSWSPTTGLNANNISNPSAYPLTTTTYELLVTDSNGCQAYDAVTITVHQNPITDAGVDVSLISCIGDSVRIGGSPSASNGGGGYTYAWAPIGGLSATNIANPYVRGITSSSLYALTVTDANGCSAADAVVVNVLRSTLTADAGNDVNVCFGSNTLVTLGGNPTPTGGTAPYSYSWSPSTTLNSTVVSNPFANPIETTSYLVTVTDGKGCIAVDSVIVFVNYPPFVNAGRDTSICSGGAAIAGGTPTAGGSASPYSYSWSPSVGISNVTASNPVITPVTSTTYSVIVTDGHGCTNSDAISITVNQNPAADAGPDQTLLPCTADSIQIGGTPAAIGGYSPYTYTWSPAAGISSATAANPYVSHLGSSTTYTLVVRDQHGCSASDQMHIAVNNSSLFAEAGNNVIVCQGLVGSVTLGGTPTATGGIPSYTYAWTPSAGLSSAFVANPAASPVRSTHYTVVVTDAAGCMSTDTVDFIVNPIPVVNAGSNDTICQGSCIALGGAPTADGFQGPYSYSWSPTLNLNNPTLSNPMACPTGTITYTVTVSNQYGCSASGSKTVKVNTKPIVDAGPDQTVQKCENACISLGGSATASGGSAPYRYAWSPSLSLNSTSLSNPTLCNVTATHTYSVTVTDANGCSASDDVLVQGIASDLVADAGPDKSICAGQNNCITIGGAPSVTGGTGPFIISWSPVSAFCNSNIIPNPDVNPVDPTTYVLLVRDAKGCVSADSMRVNANPAVTAIVNPDTSICSGSSGTIGGYPGTGSGGTPPYSYAWSPTIGMSGTTTSNPSVSPLVTTTYCVTVTDAAGCSTSTCQAVNVNSPITVDAGPDRTITGCRNSSTTLGGSPVARGGSGSYAYQWIPSSGIDSAQIANPHVQNLASSVTYTLIVTDRVTGCSSSDQVYVSSSPSTLTIEAGPDQSLCPDNTSGVQLGGIPTTTGGQAPYTYYWSPALGLSSTTVANPIAHPSTSMTYILNVTDALGCIFSDSVHVTIAQPVPVTINGLNPKYCLNAGNVIMSGSPAGGTFSGAGVTGNVFQPSVIGIGNWCITYTYTNPVTGCTRDTVICVTVDSLPALRVSGYNSSYCHLDAPTTLSAIPPGGTYSGAGIEGNIFYPANASIGDNPITYTYTDTILGCSNSIQFNINIKGVPSITVAAAPNGVCAGTNVSLSAQYSTDVFNIEWSDMTGGTIYSGLNAFTVNPSLANHCYTATAINTAGCLTKDTLCIDIVDCHIHAVDELCDADSVYMNNPITIRILDNDTLPSGSDTIITIKTENVHGVNTINADHTITYVPENNFSGNIEFTYQVCVIIKDFSVCDTANVCITVVDTTIKCHFPNTITPNNDGANDEFEVSCNEEYPNANVRIYSRWGAEVYRSIGHYDNKWNGLNQQGTTLPDGTYFYMYYFNDGSNRMKKGFVDVYR